MDRTKSARRRNRRYIVLLAVVVALCAGWSAFWFFAAHQAEAAIAGWRAREAKAGRVYTCGKQEVSGFPFRIEVDCTPATAQFDSGGKSYTARTDHVLVVGQIYTPGLLISEAKGPLTFGETGKPPTAIVNWKLAQSSVAGTPTNPQRVALVFDKPVVDAIGGGTEQTVLSAEHAEIHGRLVGGSISDKPVIEIALDVTKGMLPKLPSAAGKPIDTSIVARLNGLKDFTPKPWAARYREIQQAGGHIDIEKARVSQGDSVAVGSGKLSLTPQGYLQGQMTVTVAGLEAFLNSIGADMAVKNSPEMDKVAGFLDRLAPGLGNVARSQAGHITFGIKAIEGDSKLEGKSAVTLPLNFDNGAVSLGPIPLGHTPALF